MPLSKEDLALLLEKFTEKEVNLSVCPHCRKKSFFIESSGYFSFAAHNNPVHITLGSGPAIPAICLICKDCGHISFFALNILGLKVDEKGVLQNAA